MPASSKSPGGGECCGCGGTQRLCVSVQGCCFAIPGVGLRLRDSGGAELATGTTDSGGSYCFEGLADGDYTVEITGGLPALYEIDAAEPDPQSVTVSGGSASLTYMVFCDASTGYGVGGSAGTPSRRFAAIRPVAGYWCAGCTLGIPPFGQPNVQCGDPAPYPVTLTFGGHTATLGDSGCAGYACKLWMGAFTWTGTGLGLLNPAFDPTLPVTLGNQPCPISGYGGPYDVLNSTFFCLADKTGLLICGPSCTGTGYDPAYGTDIQPAADVAGMTLCNAWNAIGYPYRTPVGTSTTSGGIASFYIPWRTADCSCSPLLLAGSWTPPASYRPFWGSSPVTVSLAP